MTTTTLNLRLPRSLAEQLKATAHDEGMSLNSLLLALIAGGAGFTLNQKSEARPLATTEPQTTDQGAPDEQRAEA
jgi:hypothetical protein